MKKTYQQPTIELVKISTANIIAGSLGDGDTPTVTPGDAEGATGKDAGAHTFNIWDNED